MSVPVTSFDPVLLAVLGNRLDTIVREMENTLLRTGRSAVLNMARDFSCALITGDNQLLASAEGLPVHVIGMEFLAEAMTELHDDIVEGDAFLHNDPYLGNTHPADHVILVPVFWEGGTCSRPPRRPIRPTVATRSRRRTCRTRATSTRKGA